MSQPMPSAPSRVEMSQSLTQSLQRAAGYARQQLHRVITIEHVLLALNEDPDASLMMQACSLNQVQLHADVSGYLGHIEDRFEADNVGEPVMDPEASRIINSAVAASQKSRRSAVNGAIVLAAIIGDGRSPAANMLRAQGLTFEAAIKALQQANQPAKAPKPRHPQQQQQSERYSESTRPDQRNEPQPEGAAESGPGPKPAPPIGNEDLLADVRRRIDAVRDAQSSRQPTRTGGISDPNLEREPRPEPRPEPELQPNSRSIPDERHSGLTDEKPSQVASAEREEIAEKSIESVAVPRSSGSSGAQPPSQPPSQPMAPPEPAGEPQQDDALQPPQTEADVTGQRERPQDRLRVDDAAPPQDQEIMGRSQQEARIEDGFGQTPDYHDDGHPASEDRAPRAPHSPSVAQSQSNAPPPLPHVRGPNAPPIPVSGSQANRPSRERREREEMPPQERRQERVPAPPPDEAYDRPSHGAGQAPGVPGQLGGGHSVDRQVYDRQRSANVSPNLHTPPGQRPGHAPDQPTHLPPTRMPDARGYYHSSTEGGPPQAPMAPPMRPPGQHPLPAPMPQSAPVPRSEGAVRSGVMAGQLHETIPRRMRVWIPVTVEVRVARAEIENIDAGMQGGGGIVRHDIVVTKAMSVRLRAPEGGFSVESSSPETQWIENHLGVLSDDYASWRWTITPQRRGKARLQLIVSARTVGGDGVVAETALPEQVIDVTVSVNYARMLKTWGGWAAAAVAGGLFAKFGEGIWGTALLWLG